MTEKRRRNKGSLPRFNIESLADKKQPASIYLMYRYKKDQEGSRVLLKYSIREKILPKYWIGSPTYRAKESLNHPEYQRLNEVLSSLYTKAISTAQKNPTISIDQFKDELDYHLGFQVRPTAVREYTEY